MSKPNHNDFMLIHINYVLRLHLRLLLVVDFLEAVICVALGVTANLLCRFSVRLCWISPLL